MPSNFRHWRKGDSPKKLSADWLNQVTQLVKGEAPTLGDVAQNLRYPNRALAQVDAALTGAGYYRATAWATADRAIDSPAVAVAGDDWNASEDGFDIILVNWSDAGGGHSLGIDDYVAPAHQWGYVKDGDVWKPAYHIGGVGGSLPTGEHQYQVYQMVSDSQGGWDFVRSHPILD